MLGGSVYAQSQDDPVDALTIVTLPLSDDTANYQFEVFADPSQAWSFSAVPLDGGIDPVLRIYDEAGEVVAANDNATHQLLGARIEGWIAPAAGAYQIEVSREGGNTASGRVTFTATPSADSLVYLPFDAPLDFTLDPTEAVTIAQAVDPNKPPLKLQFEATFAPQSVLGVEFRTIGNDWMVVMGYDGFTLQRTLSDRIQVLYDVDTELADGVYQLWAEAERLQVIYEAENSVETVLDITIDDLLTQDDFSFLGNGTRFVQLVALENNAAPIRITTPYAGAPFYTTDALRAEALPPVDPSQRIYADQTVPQLVVEELQTKGYLVTEDIGGVAFVVDDGLTETSEVGFSSYPLDTANFQDFVLSFQVTLRQGAASAACGMSIRQVDGANFTAVVYSGEGSAYILPYVNGALFDETLALDFPWINQGIGASNAVLIVAEGEQVNMFINDVWVGNLAVPLNSGIPILQTILADPITTRCTYTNIWLWALDNES